MFYIQFSDESLDEAIKSHANPNGFATIEEAHAEASSCEMGKVDYVILCRTIKYVEVDKGTTNGET